MTITEEIEEVFQLQKQRAIELRTEPLEERKKRLTQLLYWIENHAEEIREAMYADFRKPEMEVNLTEIYPSLLELRQAISSLDDWAFPEKVKSPPTFMAASARIHYEPKGVCLIIAPWNYPFILAIGPMVSAIAAGNTVMLKPSEYSPATSDLLKRMVDELFDPKDVTVHLGDADVAKELLTNPFDHIFFTGSPAVGKKIMEAAAQHLSSITLELGGKSPVIVEASASPSESAERICWGKFLNAGQTCIAPDYALVHESQWEDFLKEMVFHTGKMFSGNNGSIQGSADYARIISDRHFDRLAEAIDEAVEKGATVIYGGDYDKDEHYIAPTIITDVPEDAVLMQEEIFGPILPVRKYSGIDDVISYINDRPKPLASYLFGQDEAIYEKVLKQISAGALVHNDCVVHFSHPNLPFGGVNNSGIGKSHGEYGFRAFSNEKAVVKQRLPLNKLIYPPYTKVTTGFINYLLKYF